MLRRFILLLCLFMGIAGIAYAAGFSDIAGSPHGQGIAYLTSKDIMHGYSDGTIRPDMSINRAEFLKLLGSLLYNKKDIASCVRTIHPHFADVPNSSWFAPFVCIAVKNKIASGFNDHTFKPSAKITVAEAATMLARAYHLTDAGTGKTVTPWYKPDIDALGSANAFPSDIGSPQQYASRGQAADMLWRLQEKVTDQPSITASALLNATCDWFTLDQIPHVDIEEVRRVWISWINGARAQASLAPYQQNKELDHSASVWSLNAVQKGTISHKRPGQTAYYDYAMIKNWFASLDLAFANVDRQTFTENIGWGVYDCKKSECTQDLITALRTTFDFYMGEKGKSSSPHYDSIMNQEFTQIGVGVAVDPASGKYYVTTHYGTDINSSPEPICP